MKKLSKMIVAAVVACTGVMTCSAKNLFWEGTNGTWKVGGGGWKLVNGTPATFENNDNVTFGEAPSAVTVTVEGFFEVGDVLFDATNEYTIRSKSRGANNNGAWIDGCITEMKSFEKRGSGKLNFAGFGGSWTCDMFFKEGDFQQTSAQVLYPSFSYTNSVFGTLAVPHTVTFGTGEADNKPQAKISAGSVYGVNLGDYRNSSENYSFVMPDQDPQVTIVLDGAQLYSEGHFVSGPLVFRNGGYISGGGVHQHGFAVNGDVRVERRADDQPSEASKLNSFGQGSKFIGGGEKSPITFDIQEVTSANPTNDDGVADFEFNLAIYGMEKKAFSTDCAWNKTGPGRMKVTHGFGSYKGKTEILEGTVEFTNWGSNGEAMEKQIIVRDGATIHLSGGSGSQNSIVKNLLVISNAVLRKTAGFIAIGNLKFIGKPTAEISGSWAHMSCGSLRLDELLSFEVDEPFTFNASGGANTQFDTFKNRTLDITVIDEETGATKTNRLGYTEVYVAGFTNEYAKTAEVTTIATFTNTKRNGNTAENELKDQCGMLKTGDGILVITRGSSYRYLTDIQAGGIYFDKVVNNNTPSTGDAGTIVREGGSIGGLGTVKGDLTIEAGGGFLVNASNVTARTTINGAMTLPNKVVVTIYNYYHPLSEIETHLKGIPFPDVKGDSTTIGDVSDWRVKLKGYPKGDWKNLRVRKNSNDTYDIFQLRDGLKVIVR